MTELFIRYLRISIFLLGNAKLLYIFLKIMEDEIVRLLMFQILGFLVYRVFVITMYIKNSLLEIISVNVEYSQLYFFQQLYLFSKVA